MSPRIADRFTLIHLRGFVVVLRLSFFSAPTGARMYACFLFDEPFEVFQTNRSNRACHMSRTKSPKTSYRNAFMLVHWFPYLRLCEGCVRNLFRAITFPAYLAQTFGATKERILAGALNTASYSVATGHERNTAKLSKLSTSFTQRGPVSPKRAVYNQRPIMIDQKVFFFTRCR